MNQNKTSLGSQSRIHPIVLDIPGSIAALPTPRGRPEIVAVGLPNRLRSSHGQTDDLAEGGLDVLQLFGPRVRERVRRPGFSPEVFSARSRIACAGSGGYVPRAGSRKAHPPAPAR